jgi:PAS domain S-box-containing protein
MDVLREAGGQEQGQAQQLRLALRAGGFGTWLWDKASGRTLWDPELEAIFGLPPGGFAGTYEAWVSSLHPGDRDQVLESIYEAWALRGTYEIRHRVVWPDGSVHWVQGLGQVTVDDDGQPTGTIGCTRDMTEDQVLRQKLVDFAEEAMLNTGRAEQSQLVTSALAQALTVEDVTRILAAQVDGILGACGAAVSLLSRKGASLRIVTSFGFDPDVVADDRRLPMTALTPMTDCVRAGEPVLVSAAQWAQRYPDVAGPSLVTGHTLLAALPLQVPGRRLGALLLAFSDRTEISEDELQVVAAVAGQCSQALDRAGLIERLGEVALTMQQGLTPELLHSVPGCEVAAVYEAGGDEMEHVGGDWFDVIGFDDGTFALVIGDVMGRGVAAATTMTRIRTAARAYAWDNAAPAAVMAKLDAFIGREASEDFVTMIYAVLEPATGRLTMANAGHLPAVVLRLGSEPGGGSCADLLTAGAGLPLGLTMVQRVLTSVELGPGEALLLFTDGLVERRDRAMDDGLAALRDGCSRARGTEPLQDILDQLVGELVDGHAPGDDVTALMIRRRPADGGRREG